MSSIECGNCHWVAVSADSRGGDELVFAATMYHVCPFQEGPDHKWDDTHPTDLECGRYTPQGRCVLARAHAGGCSGWNAQPSER